MFLTEFKSLKSSVNKKINIDQKWIKKLKI